MQPATDPENWKRLDELFHAACEISPADRKAWLDRECGADARLRQRLESLLCASDRSLGFLQQPLEAAAYQLTADSGFAPGQRIGAYRILETLGEGGMGTVYLAVRADEQYEQRVALKLMRTLFGPSEAMRTRFRTERQILANLQHPNIGRLLDGGVAPGGAPFLVMEYIDGLPVNEYCRGNRLSIAGRLRLFRAICDAVEYAHKSLVVHRDIKPANILVTADGTPKLLDFGIAKLLDADASVSGLTIQTERLMTPDYASPEQILNQPVTTSTDVYALGVLLYELLAGNRPFRVDACSPLEAARIICETDPVPPSVAAAKEPVNSPACIRSLRGDLDNIVLMAMRKEPARRYASAAQFAADIDAYLAGYPVRAGEDHWRYHAGKFVRRHKRAVAATAAFALSLIGFSVGMGVLARRATREQTIAGQQAQFLANVFRAATPDVALGKTITARDLLDRARERIDREPAGDAEVQAALLEDIAGAYRGIGFSADSQPLAERGYDLRVRTLGKANVKTGDALELAAEINRDRGQFAIAETRFRELVDLRRRSAGEDSALFARALTGYGETLYDAEKNTAAELPLRQALAIYNRAAPDQGSEVRNFLALVLERKPDFAEAAQLLREATEISRRASGPESPAYTISLHNLGSDLIDLGDMQGAEKALREVLAIRRKVLGSGHPELLRTLNNLGFVLLEKGDGHGAEPLLRECLESALARIGAEHPSIATYRANWARALEAVGDFAGAERELGAALAVAERQDPQGRQAAGVTYFLSALDFDRRDYAESERLARKALELHRKLSGEGNPSVASSLIQVAEDRVYQYDAPGAVPMLREALEIRRKAYQPRHTAILSAEVGLGEALVAAGEAREAEPVLREAVSAARASRYPLWPWQTAEAESALAACLDRLGKSAEADRLRAASVAGLKGHPKPAFREDAAVRLSRLRVTGPRR